MQYIHAHIEAEKTNNMNERTFAALYLGPTGNLQGTEQASDINTERVKKDENVQCGACAQQCYWFCQQMGTEIPKREEKEDG